MMVMSWPASRSFAEIAKYSPAGPPPTQRIFIRRFLSVRWGVGRPPRDRWQCLSGPGRAEVAGRGPVRGCPGGMWGVRGVVEPVEVGVAVAAGEEVGVGPDLGDSPAVEVDDLLRVGDGEQ